ncbi:MAG TPA: ATP-dependent DNA ligase [Firmicutes bacterium]|jgi:DNA ligase D-like protein (predicted ligase)|nr:ATP-dependent DNA ligase [Bacillota bacterium]HBL49857.1 ATP-dependent DNA ligase [Bacillota bacterium]HBR23012.1 ATP-dependent DNA ligase [Bacillota bacterium]HCF89588.1 ATP-dependent DNA ligase [Bacillota bacterium]HCF91074.1 ATP-dependent DNA ligase [Bacillota bacterium]
MNYYEPIKPMLAESGRPFDSKDYIFEIKWDGIRCLAFLDPDSDVTRLQSRNLLDLNPHYPDLGGLHRQAQAGACVIDGEIIALHDGRPSFLQLQKRMNASGLNLARIAKHIPVLFVAFDILKHRDRYLTDQPLETRRRLLAEIIRPNEQLLLSEAVPHTGNAFYQAACAQQLEGIMAKRLGSPYLPGKRSRDWIKIKRRRMQPFVICGFYSHAPRPEVIASLMIAAYYQDALRGFGYVGSGLAQRDIDYLQHALAPLAADAPPGPPGDFPTAGRSVHWVKPQLTCLVEYLELTEARTLRHPAFQGFCPDIPPHDCIFDPAGLFDPNRQNGWCTKE